MKRFGYAETFDKDKLTHVEESGDIELDEYKHEFVTKKVQAFSNIIEFLIGGILLTFCRFYLQTHPAEKITLFSGVEVMWQKIQMWFSDMSAEDATFLDQKGNLEKTMREIVLLSKESTCVDAQTKENIAKSYANLQSMNIDTFKKQQGAFNTVVSLYYTKVKSDCE